MNIFFLKLDNFQFNHKFSPPLQPWLEKILKFTHPKWLKMLQLIHHGWRNFWNLLGGCWKKTLKMASEARRLGSFAKRTNKAAGGLGRHCKPPRGVQGHSPWKILQFRPSLEHGNSVSRTKIDKKLFNEYEHFFLKLDNFIRFLPVTSVYFIRFSSVHSIIGFRQWPVCILSEFQSETGENWWKLQIPISQSHPLFLLHFWAFKRKLNFWNFWNFKKNNNLKSG